MMRFRILFILATTFCIAPSLFGQKFERVETPRRPMTFEDMYAFGRVSDPQVSPNGKTVLYVVTSYSLASNSSNSDIYTVPADGGLAVRLTSTPKTNTHPRWAPDGNTIAFISDRDGTAQVWLMNTNGTEQRKLTSFSTGVDDMEWSPTGRHIAFTSSVYADCQNDDCNRKRDEERGRNPVKARVISRLPYRVWNAWKDDKYRHVFVMPSDGGTPTDLTPGAFDSPPIDLAGHADYAFSPDGLEIAFVRNTSDEVAWSTNNDVWLVKTDGSNARCITGANKANDNQPVYSPDGRYIAYRAMRRPGYESDKYDLMVYERASGKVLNVTDGGDRSVDEVMWSRDGKRLLFTAPDGPYNSLFEVPAAGGDILRVLKGIITMYFTENEKTVPLEVGTFRTQFRLHPDGKTLYYVGQRINYPAEMMSAVYENGQVKSIRQVTTTNQELVEKLDLPEARSFQFKSFDGTDLQGWMLQPPNFDPARKYPMIFLVHGGPQGQWSDEFHYRWNMELFAAPGFVIVAINPRGSTGFGQSVTDGVNGDWGGAPFKDLMKGLDYALKTFPFIDKNRIGAAGASYGGYMMNWMLGNTDRFKAFFTHAGVYDLVSMYGGTEELWFPEWEFRGTPWTNPKLYEKLSPSTYAKNFRTPTLVSHGQLDFRVPVEQGMQLFSTLQRQKIESKFLYFPDEGHTVLKPRNAQLWYSEFQEWFRKHLMQ